MNVQNFRERMCARKAAALADSLLISEVFYATWYDGSEAPNGICCRKDWSPFSHYTKEVLTKFRNAREGTKTALVVLDPRGPLLSRSR